MNFVRKLSYTACECIHLVTGAHFRSRDKDGCRTIRSTLTENPVLDANLIAQCFIEPELLPTEVLHRGIFFTPVTLILTSMTSI